MKFADRIRNTDPKATIKAVEKEFKLLLAENPDRIRITIFDETSGKPMVAEMIDVPSPANFILKSGKLCSAVSPRLWVEKDFCSSILVEAIVRSNPY